MASAEPSYELYYYRNYNIDDNFRDVKYKFTDPAPSIVDCENVNFGQKG